MDKGLSSDANLERFNQQNYKLTNKIQQESIHVIHSDQGSLFRSKYWKTELEKLQISPTITSLYHPQSHELSERNIQNILNKFRI
jgi:transposase InsO family protein